MTTENRSICLVGQAIVDVTLPHSDEPYKMRLGGILHAARALWALETPYTLAYLAPSYLHAEVQQFAAAHGATASRPIGVVEGSPNVLLIGEAKEAGDQGYEYLLRDQHRSQLYPMELEVLLQQSSATDILVISGGFDLAGVLTACSSDTRCYVDLTGASDDWRTLRSVERPLEGLTLSTSSRLFRERFGSAAQAYWADAVPAVTHAALLKENRGGARLCNGGNRVPVSAPAFLGDTAHSVGVGDCYDAVWVALRRMYPDATALAYASLVAAEYAATTYPDDFKAAASAATQLPADEVTRAVGVVLPWEARPSFQVYVAGPDFDFADRRPINAVAAALQYHNFMPRLPVRENGQMGEGATAARRAALLAADLRLLDECRLMIAVLTYNDPGTLIEIGLAYERGMPVIVYDPNGRAENLMLTSLPVLVTSDLERVVSEVYRQAGRQ